MPKASEVAAELRKFADRLDREPDENVVKPYIYFSHSFRAKPKESFMALARLMPRPIKKSDGYTKEEMKIEYESASLDISASVQKIHTCILVEAAREAVYECEPLLSEAELATVEA